MLPIAWYLRTLGRRKTLVGASGQAEEATKMQPARVFRVLSLVGCVATSPLDAQAPESFSRSLKVTGYLQPRFQVVGDSAVFFLRRARVAVEGSVTPWASYRAQIEMRTIGAPPTPPASPLTLSATDLFLKLSHGRWGATVGQFR